MTHAESQRRSSPSESARGQAALEVALIFLVFFIHAGWPAPEVNEPHYLGKSKHYWNAAWCAHDFFLNTSDAHESFYFAFGWVTRFLTLPQAAWTGRLVTWALLAWSWRRLSASLLDGKFYAVLTAALFVTLNERFHMAGEWVVGGVEAKGFAYVLVFLGLEAIVSDRFGRAFLLLGAASAFHVIVGGWAVVCGLVTWALTGRSVPLRTLVLPLIGGLLLSLPGLWPALRLAQGADATMVTEANRIYVYERLTHHLLPQAMRPDFIVRHVLLIAAFVGLAWYAPRNAKFTRLRAFVAAGVGISAVGFLIALAAQFYPDQAAALLRYYWFRMSDVLVPAGVAFSSAAILANWEPVRPRAFLVGLLTAIAICGVHLGRTVYYRQIDPWPPADFGVVDLNDWRSACRWASEESPGDAVFLTPRLDQTFHWYAHRAQVVSRKDLPQDAAGIVEWRKRLVDLYGRDDGVATWFDQPARLSLERLLLARDRYGATHVITSPHPPLPLEMVGPHTSSVVIYRLPEKPSSP